MATKRRAKPKKLSFTAKLFIVIAIALAIIIISGGMPEAAQFFKATKFILPAVPKVAPLPPTPAPISQSTGSPTALADQPGAQVTKIGNAYYDCVGPSNDTLCSQRPNQLLGPDCGNGKIDPGENYFTCPQDVPCIGKEILGKCAIAEGQISLPNGKQIFLYFDDYFNNDVDLKTKILAIVNNQIDIIYNNFLQKFTDKTYILIRHDKITFATGEYGNSSLAYVTTVLGFNPGSDSEAVRHELTHNLQASFLGQRSVCIPINMVHAYEEGTAVFFQNLTKSSNLESMAYNQLWKPFFYLRNENYSEAIAMNQEYYNSYSAVALWQLYYFTNKNFFKEFEAVLTRNPDCGNNPTKFFSDLASITKGSGYLFSEEHLSKVLWNDELYWKLNITDAFLVFEGPQSRYNFVYAFSPNPNLKTYKIKPIHLTATLQSFDGKYLVKNEVDSADNIVINPSPSTSRPQAGIATFEIKTLDGTNREVTFQKLWTTDIYVQDLKGTPVEARIDIKPNKYSVDKNTYNNIKLSKGIAKLDMPLDLRDIDVYLPSGSVQTFTNVIVPSSYAILTINEVQPSPSQCATGEILVDCNQYVPGCGQLCVPRGGGGPAAQCQQICA